MMGMAKGPAGYRRYNRVLHKIHVMEWLARRGRRSAALLFPARRADS